jgi:hypothetical protein
LHRHTSQTDPTQGDLEEAKLTVDRAGVWAGRGDTAFVRYKLSAVVPEAEELGVESSLGYIARPGSKRKRRF